MATHVVQRMSLSALVANHDQAFTGEVRNEIIAGFCDLTLMPDQHPLPGKNLLLLLSENLGRNKIPLRQRLCACLKSFSRFVKWGCCFRLRQRHTASCMRRMLASTQL